MKYLVFLNCLQSVISPLTAFYVCNTRIKPLFPECERQGGDKARLRLFCTLREMSERKKNISTYIQYILALKKIFTPTYNTFYLNITYLYQLRFYRWRLQDLRIVVYFINRLLRQSFGKRKLSCLGQQRRMSEKSQIHACLL